ncbi:MAG TPA: YafY family protein [Bacteroidales bacterium]|nr:YafY family protein [Bacteroidales bacterium]
MNRIDRLVAILTFMQSRRLVKASDIAERFDISLRTVYRDVRALQESGIPVCGEAGSGYTVEAGYHLPPVMFTREEAAAIFTGAKMIDKYTDLSVNKHFCTALEKVKAVIRYSDKEYLEKIDNQILVLRPPSEDSEFPNCFMVTVQKAIAESHIVNIEYFSGYKKETTRRKVEPIGVCFYSARWHLFGYCKLRNEYRDFRLDRIKQLEITDEKYTSAHPTVQELIPKLFDNSAYLKVSLLFPFDMQAKLAEQKYYYGFIEEVLTPEGILMHFMTDSYEWIERWVLSLGKNVTIVGPQAFKDLVKSKVKALTEHYQG